jgi:hypothetical protein
MSRLVLRLLALLLPATLIACSDQAESACPAYKAFDGIFLDYREADLPPTVSGRICLDDVCRTLREWEDLGGPGQGQVNLPMSEEQQDVRLRVDLGSGGQALRLDQRVELVAVYNADRNCGVYGYSRAVSVGAGGQVKLGGATPGKR